MRITYRDEPLLLEDPGHELYLWMDRLSPMDGLHFFSPPLWYAEGWGRSRSQFLGREAGTGTIGIGLPMPNYTHQFPPRWRLNTLWWPTGAARWAIGLFLVTDEQARQFDQCVGQQACYDGIPEGDAYYLEVWGTEAELSSREVITAEDGRPFAEPTPPDDTDQLLLKCKMHCLHPRMVSLHGAAGYLKEKGLSIMVLVDDRYFWQFNNMGDVSLDESSTWSDAFGVLNTAGTANRRPCHGTITYDTVPSGYDQPNPYELNRKYESVSLYMDGLSASVGQRIVCQVDGTIESQNYTTARDNLLRTYECTPIAGGSIWIGNDDQLSADRSLPEIVNVVFPQCGEFGADEDLDIWVVEVTVDSSIWDASHAGFRADSIMQCYVRTVHTSYCYTGSNSTDCTNLATQIATDLINYMATGIGDWQGEETWPGIFNPEKISGYHDYLWWHLGAQYQKHQPESRPDVCPVPIPTMPEDEYLFHTIVGYQPHNFGVTQQLSWSGIDILQSSSSSSSSAGIGPTTWKSGAWANDTWAPGAWR